MTTSSLPSCLLSILVLALTQTSLAYAEDADSLIRIGVQLRREGKDQEALKTFQRAYSLAPSPRALAQMGTAEQAIGLWTDAQSHVAQALQATGDPWIVKNRTALESALAAIQTHIGQIQIVGGPPGAEVRIEGKLAGTLPMATPVPMAAGTAAVEVRAAEHLPASRVVPVSAGELSRETIILQKVALSTPASNPVGIDPSQTETPVTAPVAQDAGSSRRRLAWVALGGAGLFLAAGATGLIVRESNARWFTNPVHGCDETSPSRGRPGCKDAFDRGQTAKTLGIVGLVTAGVLGAGSAALFMTASKSGKGEGSTLSMICAPHLAGLSCATRF